MDNLKRYRLFVILYIIVAMISVFVVNVIFQLLRCINREIEKSVSPAVPLKIWQRCMDEFDKIDVENDKDLISKSTMKYDCVVFGGGGYKTIQYTGYLAYLLKHDLIDENTKFVGSSLGSCWSVLTIIAYDSYVKEGKEMRNNDKLFQLWSYALVHTIEARMNLVSLFGNWWDNFQNLLKEILFDTDKFHVDISLFDNDKLEIVATKIFPLPSKQIFNKFEDKMDLLNCLCASCMIPFWSINSPVFYWKDKDNYFVDGGFTRLIPKGKSKRNLIVYNGTVWYRTFVPFINEDDYVQDIVAGYIKCKQLARNLSS